MDVIQLIIIITVQALLISLVGVSFLIIYSSCRFFHIAHAITLSLTSYFFYFFYIQMILPLVLSVILALCFSTLLMALIEVLIYRPFRIQELQTWKFLILSLGLYIISQNVISLIWGDNTLSIRSWSTNPIALLPEVYITEPQLVIISSSLLLLIGTWFIVSKTNYGLKLRAISMNRDLPGILGLQKNKIILSSFLIGSFLGASSSILISLDFDMKPTMGFDWLLSGVIAMIIGGIGKIHHTVAAAFIIASIQYTTAYYLDSRWMNASMFFILILLLSVKPFGLSGIKLKKTEI